MLLFGKNLFGLVVILFLFATPPPAAAVIEDVLDVIHVVKEVTVGILKAWDIIQQSEIAQNIEFPLMREKQRKVLQRLKDMSRQIDQTEQKYAQNVALAVESLTEFIDQNLPLMSKMNDIQDTINRISSRFQQMQKYEAYQDKLEASTLVAFAEWTVSPNAHSVHHLMERLHLILLGPEEKENTTMNVLSLLAKTYEILQPLKPYRSTLDLAKCLLRIGNEKVNSQLLTYISILICTHICISKYERRNRQLAVRKEVP